MGSNMEIFEARVLGENLSLRFPPKTLVSNISMLEPIPDNDNYKPHAKKYSNLSMFTQVIA
jgi:hypothetical protein